MSFIWRYDFTRVYVETLQTIIGLSRSITLAYIDSHSDSTSLYVAWSGSDSTGDGTAALPFRTIGKAMTELDSGHTIITIMDSNTYDSDLTVEMGDAFIDLNGITLQGMEGENPVILVDTSSQSYIAKVSNGGKLINVGMTSIEDSGNQITAIEITDGTVKNVEIDGTTKNGINIPAGSTTVNLTNVVVHGCLNRGTTDGNGINISEGTVTMSRVLVYGNQRAGIYVTGSDSKIIDMDYVTDAENQYGVYAYGSSNAAITVINSIIYNNKIYDYYHNTIAACTTSCIGSIYGLADFSRIVFNPFFVSSTDFRVRTIQNGYNDGSYISPIIGQSSTGKDLGCYDYARSMVSETYSQFETERSDTYRITTKNIDSSLNYTNSLLAKQAQKGAVDSVFVGWDNIINSESENIKLMYESEATIFLSIDNGLTFTEYQIDKTRDLDNELGLNKYDDETQELFDIWKGVSLNLLKL